MNTGSVRVLSEERVTREDLVLFINACFACTAQGEFYGRTRDQRVSIEFLHQYILENYRRLYARSLAAGINHFNQALIVANLLATGRKTPDGFRAEEGALIRAALRRLPAPRVFRLLESLRKTRVNNRRARAVARDYLAWRRDPALDAVKYRSRLKSIATHAHLELPGEVGAFLFDADRRHAFENELLESFRQARYSKDAIYRLPYTVAEGFAARHGVPRDELLAKIAGQMTAQEKLRLQAATDKAHVKTEIDLSRAPLTKLALYVLSLRVAEREARRAELDSALTASAQRSLRRAPVKLGKVAAVLDASYSSSGSGDKRRRPLGVALAAHYLLREASSGYRAFWTPPQQRDPVLVAARGQTDLASPILDALEWRPDLLVIVSDGLDNDPPGAAAEILSAFRRRLDPARAVGIVHTNPVFDEASYAPKTLSAAVPTVGIRDAEDLPTMIGFARFADGAAPLDELESYLAHRVTELIGSPDPNGLVGAPNVSELIGDRDTKEPS